MPDTIEEHPPSLAEILYALTLALGLFVDALLADAAREGRAPSPALRRLARILRAIRCAGTLCFKPGAPSGAHASDTPAPLPRATRATRTRALCRAAMRRHVFGPADAAAALLIHHVHILPEPARTLEL